MIAAPTPSAIVRATLPGKPRRLIARHGSIPHFATIRGLREGAMVQLEIQNVTRRFGDFAALDAKLREDLQLELINLQKEVGITFVYVTHDQTEALTLSHRIAVMNKGRVEQLDEPSKIYGFPRTRFVADFIGQCNLFSGLVAASSNC